MNVLNRLTDSLPVLASLFAIGVQPCDRRQKLCNLHAKYSIFSTPLVQKASTQAAGSLVLDYLLLGQNQEIGSIIDSSSNKAVSTNKQRAHNDTIASYYSPVL